MSTNLQDIKLETVDF